MCYVGPLNHILVRQSNLTLRIYTDAYKAFKKKQKQNIYYE